MKKRIINRATVCVAVVLAYLVTNYWDTKSEQEDHEYRARHHQMVR